VKLAVHLSNFTWPGGAERIGSTLQDIGQAADAAGIDRLSVMDHFFQISFMGPPENEMLEAYTTLGFLAAHTERVKLLTLVTGTVYRKPGLLAKMVTTLDVLSGGRAMLGIGAAWNEEEARGLGLDFPPLAERFEHLEETVQICLQMWSENDGAFEGKHHQLTRTLNSPQSLTRPHPPILIGGSGEKKTLRLVAKYADACNLFPSPELQHKLNVLRDHCEREGRDYDDIEKTVLFNFDLGADGENVASTIDGLRQLAAMGFTVAEGMVSNVESIRPLEILGREVIPVVSEF